MQDPLAAARGEIVTAGARLVSRGLVRGSSGNISIRVGDAILVTPTGVDLDALTEGELAVLDPDGNQTSGPLAPTSESSMHLALYAGAGAGVGAVVHTHAPVATALACTLEELPVVHYEMLLLGGAIKVAPFAAFGTEDLARGALEALKGRSVALLANHGTVAVGPDLSSALRATELLEWSATVYWRAASVGPVRTLTDGEMQATIESAMRLGYGTPRPTQIHPTTKELGHDA